VAEDFAIVLLHPRIEGAEGLERGSYVNLRTEVPQAAEAGRDV